MSILVGSDTKLVVAGLTGREGSFHGGNNKRYGTDLVAGVTPGKGGQDVDGTPIFDTMHEAVDQAGANTAMIFVPPRFAADSILGSSFIDVISLFEQDDQTELIVMCGEIGGDEEEKTAEYIGEHVSKPVLAYIAGFTAPPGKTMGHAGAIVSGSSGTAAAKAEALEAKGVRVGRTPTEVSEIAVDIAGSRV